MFGVIDTRDLEQKSTPVIGCFACCRVFTGGGSACFCLQLICLVKLHTVSSSLVGVVTIKYPLMAPHRSSHPASGSPPTPPVCVFQLYGCVLFAPCVFHWRRVFHRTCVVCFICRLVGLVSCRVGSQAWRVGGCGSFELESGG